MNEENPYLPPVPDLDVGRPSCPKCSAQMESGEFRSFSRIRWASEKVERWRMLVLGGKDIAKARSSISCRYQAHHCPRCRLYLFDEPEKHF
ncbi:PF20097 family protein [Roseibacillus persicicus]|uniref:PF20097 family protein n=1 Tax=Roseibacillus persicicus TaxID=454148 RepID=UPI00280CC08F|nr:PF20097 family protein [Roseibacillus persicicus]MDQ8191281.1 PF20097 family protein [Roseibacillus persicicus]